jgi:hypothetical protein
MDGSYYLVISNSELEITCEYFMLIVIYAFYMNIFIKYSRHLAEKSKLEFLINCIYCGECFVCCGEEIGSTKKNEKSTN